MIVPGKYAVSEVLGYGNGRETEIIFDLMIGRSRAIDLMTERQLEDRGSLLNIFRVPTFTYSVSAN